MDKTASNSSYEPNPTVNVRKLGLAVRSKRRKDKMTLVQVAEQTGISAATLSRLERQIDDGEAVKITPDLHTITLLAKWLSVSVDDFLPTSILEVREQNMPEFVEAHLRADRNLDNESAKKLADLFRLAYEQYSSPTGEGDDQL